MGRNIGSREFICRDKELTMPLPSIVFRQKWASACAPRLTEEKAMTRALDALAVLTAAMREKRSFVEGRSKFFTRYVQLHIRRLL